MTGSCWITGVSVLLDNLQEECTEFESVECVLMMIRRDTKRVRGGRVPLSSAAELQVCSCMDMCAWTAPVMAPS